MIERVKIIHSPSLAKEMIRMHTKHTRRWNITNGQRLLLNFGISSCSVILKTSSTSERNEVGISEDVMKKLAIPDGCVFQLKRTKDSLDLGPYIGIILKKKQAIRKLKDYTKFYDLMKGAILTFDPQDVQTKGKSIHGRMYRPQDGTWMKGRYRYPSVILNREWTKKSLINHFKRKLGNRVINDYRYNKLKVYTCLNKNAKLKNILPHTTLFRHFSDITTMLEEHKEVYMKPLSGSGGRYIFKIVKNKNKMIIRYRDPISRRNVTKRFRSLGGAASFIKRRIDGKVYLIQQGIRLLSHEGKLVDFRMLLLKDQSGEWKDMGLIARYGVKNSIVSNISAGGLAEEGLRALKKLLDQKGRSERSIRKQMMQCAVKAANQLEASGMHLGNLGFDFALDKDLKLWLLEINHNNPDHTIALDAGKKKIYSDTIKANLMYAKKLSGFI